MKKFLLGMAAGILTVPVIFTALYAAASLIRYINRRPYEHVDFVSSITQEECRICANDPALPCSQYWGKDNVGILNLNTLDIMYLEINCSSPDGSPVAEPSVLMFSSSLHDTKAQTYASGLAFPDKGYADVEISGVRYTIDRQAVESGLCQTCLDSINSTQFWGQPPAEFAVVGFEDRTLRPIVKSCTWFSTGNFGINCDFGSASIDLLIHALK